ncbi:hypothetical protein RB653_002616 [Dictyostelium firmibasis]|uniref:Right handed beta helix domain-containing protein n=1 Tax=Dictyostelium firmibasis TaxID=79012 RepID=A0AAN7YVS2_9MYCE
MKLKFILSIIFSIYILINIASSVPIYTDNCIWWVKYDANSVEKNGNFTNPFSNLKAAIDKVSNINSGCDEKNITITRVIYIIASDKDDKNVYTGSGSNTFITVSDIFYRFPILIQAIDEQTTYQFNESSPLLPMASPNRYATFVGSSPNEYIIYFQSALTPITVRGLQFKNGGFSTDDFRQASVVTTSSISVSFEYCLFRDNVGGSSGALFYNSQTAAHIESCIFENNKASTGNGGGIYLPAGTAKLEIRNSIFRNNMAINGGGIYCAYQYLIMHSNKFISNTASKSGGGLYTLAVADITSVSWDYLLFDSNKAINGSGLFDSQSANQYYNATFISNVATENGGGSYLLDSKVFIQLSNYQLNKAARGGGIFALDSESGFKTQLFVRDANFTMNSATENGGAIYCNNATARFNTLNEFTDNSATNSSSSTDYCTSSCVTSPGGCGCPGGCGIKSNDKNPNTDAKIAVAIFIPITAVLLGVVGFLLWRTHSKSRGMRTKTAAPYDEIRLSPSSQDNDDQL